MPTPSSSSNTLVGFMYFSLTSILRTLYALGLHYECQQFRKCRVWNSPRNFALRKSVHECRIAQINWKFLSSTVSFTQTDLFFDGKCMAVGYALYAHVPDGASTGFHQRKVTSFYQAAIFYSSPQTSSAISLISLSFIHCSSSVSLFPISHDANPHWGLKYSLSRGTYFAAS